MKLAGSDGRILWLSVFGGAEDRDDRAWAIVVGPDDRPVVTGLTANADDSADYLTAKLDSEGGAIIWSRSLPGAVNNPDERAGWLAVCDNGDIAMVNRTWTPITSFDVVLHRYGSADGGTIWARQYGSAGAIPDDPKCMIRDRAGDFLVSGVSNGNYMVLKFHVEDGSLRWSSSYNGPAGGYDGANCVTEGPDGEVIASGFSTGATTGWDATTVAFDPGDGSQLWAERFDAGAGLTDEAAYMEVSPFGDLYIVGYSYGPDTDSDLLTLRYSLGSSVSVDESAVPWGLPGIRFLSVGPNPFKASVSFSFVQPEAGPIRLGIYDSAGRLVARQAVMARRGGSGTGTQRLVWDGRGPDGSEAPPGVYLVRVEGGRASGTCKVVRVR